MIGEPANGKNVERTVEREGVGSVNAFAREHLFAHGAKARVLCLEGMGHET
jgi:hypothetical protein